MSEMMTAAVVRDFGAALHIEQVPIATPGPGQILIKLATSGVCHTDLHAARGDWPVKPRLPLIPGHEDAGYVVALGQGVRDIKEDDRVGVPWLHSACGRCKQCLGGWETLSEAQQNPGEHQQHFCPHAAGRRPGTYRV